MYHTSPIRAIFMPALRRIVPHFQRRLQLVQPYSSLDIAGTRATVQQQRQESVRVSCEVRWRRKSRSITLVLLTLRETCRQSLLADRKRFPGL
jgi:hypothetical protein